MASSMSQTTGTHRKVQQARDKWITISDVWTGLWMLLSDWKYAVVSTVIVELESLKFSHRKLTFGRNVFGLEGQYRESRHRSQRSTNFFCEELTCHEVGSTYISTWGTNAEGGLQHFFIYVNEQLSDIATNGSV